MPRNIDDAIESMRNMIRETEFEDDFISLSMKANVHGELIIETKTMKPEPPFQVYTNRKDEIVRRRFRKDLGVIGSPVVVEVWEDGAREWIPEEEADWVGV